MPLVSRFRNSHDLDIGPGRISEARDTSNLLISQCRSGFDVRSVFYKKNKAKVEPTTLGEWLACFAFGAAPPYQYAPFYRAVRLTPNALQPVEQP
jgi:hypothetical protein